MKIKLTDQTRYQQQYYKTVKCRSRLWRKYMKHKKYTIAQDEKWNSMPQFTHRRQHHGPRYSIVKNYVMGQGLRIFSATHIEADCLYPYPQPSKKLNK